MTSLPLERKLLDELFISISDYTKMGLSFVSCTCENVFVNECCSTCGYYTCAGDSSDEDEYEDGSSRINCIINVDESYYFYRKEPVKRFNYVFKFCNQSDVVHRFTLNKDEKINFDIQNYTNTITRTGKQGEKLFTLEIICV